MHVHERTPSLLHARQKDARTRFMLWPFKSRQSFLVNHFSGCHSDERGLGEVQWYWDAVTALSMWILTLRYGDALRLWTETAMRWDAHARTSLPLTALFGWSYCPWIPKRGRKPWERGDLCVFVCETMNAGVCSCSKFCILENFWLYFILQCHLLRMLHVITIAITINYA